MQSYKAQQLIYGITVSALIEELSNVGRSESVPIL